ncbi:MAG: trp operon repressor [Desulfotalea sp.]
MKYRKQVAKVFASITEPKEMEQFLTEMLTTKELNDLAMRWQLLCDLQQGESQRNIAAKHGISLCKITRGSKILKDQNGITAKLLNSST